MNILEEATNLVRAIEAHQVGRKESEFWLFAWLQRHLKFVPNFISTGANAKIADVFIILSLGFLVTSVAGKIPVPSANSVGMIGKFGALLGVIVVFGPVAFALPSTYGRCGVDPEELTNVTQHLVSRGFATAQEIELIWKSIKSFEDRSRSRVAATKWAIGILWASAIYMFGKVLDVATAAGKDLLQDIMFSAGLFVAVVLTYALVWSYEAAIDKLFRTIEFGCNDYCLTLMRNVPEATLARRHEVAVA